MDMTCGESPLRPCGPPPPLRGGGKKKARLALSTLAALLSACAGDPFVPPSPPVASGAPFVSADAALYTNAEPQGDWWRLYDDPVLDKLIAEGFAANTDLRVAEGNLRRARALLSESRAARFPATEISAKATEFQSRPRANAIAADDDPNDWEAWATASYEIDLFGRIEKAVRAARADADAQQAAYDRVRIAVAADIARAYADVCALGANERAIATAVAAQSEAAAIAGAQAEAGEVSPLEAAQARAEFARTRAALPGLDAERRNALFRLAALTGRPPADYPREAESCAAAPSLQTPIPVGDAGALLRRRPDVREAEQRLAAATARIGVAVADFYPRVSIGLAAGATDEQGSGPVRRLQATPLLTWIFPNIAATRARVKEARAGADVALAEWDGAVLNALRETETALVSYAAEAERHRALAVMREQSRIAAEQARLRRDAGEESPLAQLDAERRHAEAEALLAGSARELANRQIELFLALGGGWEQPSR